MKKNLKYIIKIYGFLITLFMFNPRLHSQDTTAKINLSVNVFQALINESSLKIEYRPWIHHSFGLSLGKLYYDKFFKVNILSWSQDRYPGAVYNGNTFRLNYSYYIILPERDEFFIGLQYTYKKMWYNNVSFVDQLNDGGPNRTEYTRNEKAFLYAWHLIGGYNQIFKSKSKHLNTFLSYIFGIGYDYRIRNIENLTPYIKNPNGPFKAMPKGNEKVYQNYPTIILGVNLGLEIH